MNKEKYRQLVIEHFKPFYENVDKSHGLEHVNEVTDLALEVCDKINEKYSYPISAYDVIVAGIAHDIFSYTDRDEHHTKAMEYILQDTGEIYNYVTNQQHIACAVGEHRASYKGEYTSILSEIISAADRGRPNLHDIIKRVYECACDSTLVFNLDKDIDTSISIKDLKLKYNQLIKDGFSSETAKTYVHLEEKYSRNGYARYNETYLLVFNNELQAMWKEIDDILANPMLLFTYRLTATNWC